MRAPSYELERNAAIAVARAAGDILRRHLSRGAIAVDHKADGSPVTPADLEANAAIVDLLARRFPDDAILAEETPDDEWRFVTSRVWLVDPLDGTRDFIAGTGEFAVHVALVVDGVPAVGVVHQPIGDRLFHAVRGQGAFERTPASDRRLAVAEADPPAPLIGVTRHPNDALRRFRATSKLASGLVERGASLKLVAVATGELDASLALTTCEREWDTCAPELVVVEAGGVVTDLDGAPLRYNQADLRRTRGILASSGRRHAALLDHVRPFIGS